MGMCLPNNHFRKKRVKDMVSSNIYPSGLNKIFNLFFQLCLIRTGMCIHFPQPFLCHNYLIYSLPHIHFIVEENKLEKFSNFSKIMYKCSVLGLNLKYKVKIRNNLKNLKSTNKTVYLYDLANDNWLGLEEHTNTWLFSGKNDRI